MTRVLYASIRKGNFMKKVTLCLALFAAASMTAVSARAAGSGAKSSIEKLNQNWVAAWNAHDAKKMMAMWASDGDLINPFGRKASGRAEIEKLFTEEQGGVMKASTYTTNSLSIRELNASTAISDSEGTVTGMVDPSGKALPPFVHEVSIVYVKKGGHWLAASVRAWAKPQPPPGK